jgi:hypothetical protein
MLQLREADRVLVFWCYFLTLLRTFYLSCIIDTSCKQTLRLALSQVSTVRTRTDQRTIRNTLIGMHRVSALWEILVVLTRFQLGPLHRRVL